MATQKSHRTANFAQAVAYTLIVLAILGTLNFLANRYNKSFDSTSNKKFTLSDQTAKIAKNLQQPVTITYWDRPTGFQNARDLLDRYKNLSTKISVSYEDVDKRRTQAIAAGVKTLPTIDIKVGNKKEEAKSLTEEEISGALVRALKGGDRMVCFVLGSGEHSADDTDREGFSTAKSLSEKNNYKTQTVKMLPKPEIPKDCTIVVVPGPKRDYIQLEVDALKNYVEDGGRALFLLDPPLKFGRAVDDNQGLVDVLSSWGVTPEKDLVLDAIGAENFRQPGLAVVISYEQHVIVADLKKKQEASGFLLARSLDVKNGNKTSVEKLFSTTKRSLGVKNLASAEIARSKDDLPGPLTLAAAGTYNTGKEDGKGLFVVVGNSRWITNGSLDFYGNSDLMLNTINWLSSDEDLISIRPRESKDRRLVMNESQVKLVFYGSVIGIPLLILIAGIGVWWRRR